MNIRHQWRIYMIGRVRRPARSIMVSRYTHAAKTKYYLVGYHGLWFTKYHTYEFFYCCRYFYQLDRQNRRIKQRLEYLLKLHLPQLSSLQLELSLVRLYVTSLSFQPIFLTFVTLPSLGFEHNDSINFALLLGTYRIVPTQS